MLSVIQRWWKEHENAILFGLFVVIFGAFAVVRGQPQDWDLLDYHYYNGYAFLHWRYFHDISPAMVQSHLNPFFDLLNYFLISTQPAMLAVFEQGAISGVTAFLSYLIAVKLLGDIPESERRGYALLAVFFGATASASVLTMSLMSNDNKMALMIMGSLYAFMKGFTAADARRQKIWVALAGLIIGMAAAFKLVAACYAVGFGVALVLCARPNRHFFELYILYGVSTLLGFLAANGYWMVLWCQQYGNPFFPYYNDVFRSPYSLPISFKDMDIIPQNFWELPYLWAFKKHVPKMEAVLDVRPLILLILFVGAVVVVGLRYVKGKAAICASCPEGMKVFWRFLVIWFLASFVFWYAVFSIHRYLIPLELMMGFFIVYLLRWLTPPGRYRWSLLAVLLIACLLTTHPLGKGFKRFSLSWESMTQKMFVVSELPNLPETSVVMFTYDAPAAFLIPNFPQGVRFIGLSFVFSEMNDASDQTLLAQQAMGVIRNAGENLYVITGDLQVGSSKFTLQEFLTRHSLGTQGDCQPIKMNVEPPWLGPLRVCKVVKPH